MSEETLIAEDQSHYEVSLTAGQAFLAFVLLLLSLAASFAFGLMIGKQQGGPESSVLTPQPSVTPLAKKSTDRIVELPVADDDFKAPEVAASAPAILEEPAPVTAEPAAETTAAPRTPSPAAAVVVPHIAQLFSSSDQKAAEGMAARLIDAGFMSAYVERGTNDKGPVFRVRVRFPSESEARAAEAKLREFSKEVWITKQ